MRNGVMLFLWFLNDANRLKSPWGKEGNHAPNIIPGRDGPLIANCDALCRGRKWAFCDHLLVFFYSSQRGMSSLLLFPNLRVS